MKLIRIKSRQDFLTIQKYSDIKYHSTNFLILVKKNNEYIKKQKVNAINNFIRFGFVATKKINKKAVIRNSIKRKIKEIIRILIKEQKELFTNNFDYEIIAKSAILDSSFKNLKSEFIDVFNNIKEKNE